MSLRRQSTADVLIRKYTKADYDVVMAMWTAGFLEMAPQCAQTGMWKVASWMSIIAPVVMLMYPTLAMLLWTAAACSVGLAAVHRVTLRKAEAAIRQVVAEGVNVSMEDEKRFAVFLVAEAHGKVVGCVGAKRFEAGEGDKYKYHKDAWAAGAQLPVFEIERLSVHPSARRLGVAKLLMSEVERRIVQDLADKNADQVKIQLITAAQPAKRFYEKLNFVRSPKTPIFSSFSFEAHRFEKVLKM
eukprot:ANDGO_08082.mRNA.1 hypothetical protein